MNRKIDNMNTKLELLIEFVDKMKDGPNDGKLCKEYRDNAAQLKKNPEPVMDNQELEGTDLEWTNNDPMIEDKSKMKAIRKHVRKTDLSVHNKDELHTAKRIYERNPDTGVIKSRKKGDYGNERIEHPTQEDIIAFNNKQSKEKK